jgi:hypothetical protein
LNQFFLINNKKIILNGCHKILHYLSFKKSIFGLNTTEIKLILNILNSDPKKIMIMNFIFFNQFFLKILENIMDPNVSFNSLIVPPTIQRVKLERMLKQI